jgi:hypothetical protein
MSEGHRRQMEVRQHHWHWRSAGLCAPASALPVGHTHTHTHKTAQRLSAAALRDGPAAVETAPACPP